MRPAAPPRKPASQPAELVQIKIVSARIEHVHLVPKTGQTPGGENKASNDPFLLITVSITNTSKQDLHYKSFRGAGGEDDYASLGYIGKRWLQLIEFGDLIPTGAIVEAPLKPGATITDIIVFEPPKEKGKFFLVLPKKNLGVPGHSWRVDMEM